MLRKLAIGLLILVGFVVLGSWLIATTLIRLIVNLVG